jgi:CAP-Gly domain-containing linker protein 3/4
LRYCGGTQFASGIWAGIELEEPEGKHDGTVHDVTYFRCPQNHGIFAPVNRVTKFGSRYRVFTGSTGVSRPVNFPKIDVSHVTPKVETGLTSLKNKLAEASIGDRVMLVDRRKGMIRYSGETQFAPGHWFGIELEKPLGKNDGSVNGIRYFHCPPNFGLFANPSRIMMFLKPRYRSDESDNESEYSLNMSVTSNDGYRMNPGTRRRIRALGKSNMSMRFSSYFGSKSQLASSSPFLSQSSATNDDTWLTLGVHVLVHNEIGVVRYIGPVNFAEGLWLGIELRTPHGKNDGSVQGKRYFNCKANHGLFVPPRNVSVRGINGAKLLKSDLNAISSGPMSLPGTPKRTPSRSGLRTPSRFS